MSGARTLACMQGILDIRPGQCPEPRVTLMRLWVHENMRVFHDRWVYLVRLWVHENKCVFHDRWVYCICKPSTCTPSFLTNALFFWRCGLQSCVRSTTCGKTLQGLDHLVTQLNLVTQNLFILLLNSSCLQAWALTLDIFQWVLLCLQAELLPQFPHHTSSALLQESLGQSITILHIA